MVIIWLCNIMVSSMQIEINRFFQIVNDSTVPLQYITKSAITQIRGKIRGDVFRYLNSKLSDYFYSNQPINTWNGYRLLAVDGTTLKLPKVKDLMDHFTLWKNRRNNPQAIARLSVLYDLENKLIVDAVAGPKSKGEQTLIWDHFHCLKPNDLVVMDAGYPAAWLFQYLTVNGIQWCMRMKSNSPWWKCVRAFKSSKKQDIQIRLDIPDSSLKQCQALQIPHEFVMIRLVKIKLPNGEIEILATSFLDPSVITRADLDELYQKRWGIEESIKELKCRMTMPEFSGKKVNVIYQDIYSKIFVDNLVSILCIEAQKQVQKTTGHRKHDYFVNRTQAIRKTKNVVVQLLLEHNIRPILQDLIKCFTTDIEPKRLNRKFPRKKFHPRKYFMAYKPV